VDNELTDVIISTGERTNIGSGPSSESAFFFGESSVFGAGANDRFQLGLGEIGMKAFPVEVEFKDLGNVVAGLLKISSSGTQTVAYNCPVEVDQTPAPNFSSTETPTYEGTSTTDIPTFSPTATPMYLGAETGLPTFSPTASPTYTILETGMPSFSPTSSPTTGLSATPTFSPTPLPTYLRSFQRTRLLDRPMCLRT
jgi:hypothetical protein